MPGDAECIAGMSRDLQWHQAENTLQAEMKACFSVVCKYWAGDPSNFQLNSTTPWPALHSLHVPTLTICINAFKIGMEAYQATLHLLNSLQSQPLWPLPGHQCVSSDALKALRSSLSLRKAETLLLWLCDKLWPNHDNTQSTACVATTSQHIP